MNATRLIFRLLAMLCAVAFLMGGTLHSFGCCDGSSAGSAVTVSNLADDGLAGAGAATPAVHCYCFSCSGVVLPDCTASVIAAPLTVEGTSQVQSVLHAYTPGLDTPPPRILA